MQSTHRMARGQGAGLVIQITSAQGETKFLKGHSKGLIVRSGESGEIGREVFKDDWLKSCLKYVMNKGPILERKSIKGKNKKNPLLNFFVNHFY